LWQKKEEREKSAANFWNCELSEWEKEKGRERGGGSECRNIE
jgi:hypothetical protein